MYWNTEWWGEMQYFYKNLVENIKGKEFVGLGIDGRVIISGS
jgi:hypothetical protein